MKKEKPKNAFRKIIRQAHLYLGMITGLVIFIVAITGCLWAFQEEIQQFTSDLPEIERQDQPVILPLEAKRIAKEVIPGKHVHGTLYAEENDPIEVIFYEPEPEFYHTVFLHPYSGEVLKVKDNFSGFFPFVLDGHKYLWLPNEIGSQVVAWSTVIFFVMVLTGIVLWWPRNRKARKQRFTFDWKKSTNWKRKNYDLHSVVGFYASFIAVIAIFTGLVMAFEWFKGSVYHTLGGEKEVVFSVPENISNGEISTAEIAPIDQLLYRLKEEYPQAKNLEFHYPLTESDGVYVEVGYDEGLYYNADYRFYDQYTLEELSSPSIYGIYEEAGFSEKVMRMNYDIHVGAIGGLPGKFIAFFASLLCASLPVTGFIVWYGRKYKKKKKKKKVTLVHRQKRVKEENPVRTEVAAEHV